MEDLNLKVYPNPCLRIETKPVVDFTRALKRTTQAMFKLMYSSQGIGLAAPQVGLDKSIIVVDVGKGPIVLLNPIIVDCTKESISAEEGCLSLPERLVYVLRPTGVSVNFQDYRGYYQSYEAEGLLARVIQHEIDHLSGKLIID